MRGRLTIVIDSCVIGAISHEQFHMREAASLGRVVQWRIASEILCIRVSTMPEQQVQNFGRRKLVVKALVQDRSLMGIPGIHVGPMLQQKFHGDPVATSVGSSM